MRRYQVLGLSLLASACMFGQQHVVKFGSPTGSPAPNCVSQMQGSYQNGGPAQCNVSVWSDQETNALIAQAQQNTAQATQLHLDDLEKRLNERIVALEGNIKQLSDENDALTKRLNDLEEKVNKQGQKASSVFRLSHIKQRTNEASLRGIDPCEMSLVRSTEYCTGQWIGSNPRMLDTQDLVYEMCKF